MERADFDLDHLMRATGCFDEAWTRCIIRALLETLAHLHSKNIAHCDLKPSNIMWSQNLMTLKLIEFGDSKKVKKDDSYSKSVSAPSYTAPERWKDHKGWQLKKADVWAIGVIAFEMFAGQKCFEGEDENDTFQCLSNGTWSWPEDRKPSGSMQNFIEKCLARDPRNRLSAKSALYHDWIANMSQNEGLDSKSPTQIKSFSDKEP